MAQGRMLQKRISNNKSLPKLIAIVDERMGSPHGAYAALLYTWSIAHLDVEGRMHGDPDVVKGLVFPRLAFVDSNAIREYLVVMHEVGLVVYYAAADDLWLQFPAFEGSQPGLRKDRETQSTIPDKSKGVILGAVQMPESVRSVAGVGPAEEKRSLREEKHMPTLSALELIPSDPYKPDYAAAYALYPRKEGKSRGMAKLKQAVTTPAQYERFVIAVRNYAQHVLGRDMDKVKQFDTFMGCWEDYVDGLPFVGSPSSAKHAPHEPTRPKMQTAEDLLSRRKVPA